jgi:hypothetical protein
MGLWAKLRKNAGSLPAVCVTIGATANPSSIVVAIHPIELVIGHALRGHAGPSAMVSLLDPLYPLLHMRVKSNDTWYR